MRRHFRNGWSRGASRVLAIAHTRAPAIRWAILIALAATWAVAGFIGWYGGVTIDETTGAETRIGITEAIYRTVGALSMSDIYLPRNEGALNFARFAGLAVPLIGILFAFWGQLGRSLAQALHALAADHVVIAGAGPEAIHLANDCRAKKDSVVLIGAGLGEDAAWALRKNGVFVIDGAGQDRAALRNARAAQAAHVVAFEADDTANLQIEAAMRALVKQRRRRTPIAVHVSTRAAMLLREARLMRSTEQMQLERRNADKPAGKREALRIDAKPFSLDEIAARILLQTQSMEMLDVAAELGEGRVHLVCFGFDEAAQSVVSHVFMSLWSARFEPPRVTVLASDPAEADARFKARHPQARAHPTLWAADIAFLPFNVLRDHVDLALLESVTRARGKATAVLVSAGADPDNIRLALALKRACNEGLYWPAPIFMKESTRSEFSSIYAKGDETPERDAYLLAFGALQQTATRAYIIEGRIDRGAAIAHTHYDMRQRAASAALDMKDLQAAARDWGEVLETYRAANRAVSDAAMVKVWDAGFAPMREGKGGAPVMQDDMMEPLAKREHDRWMAERLMAGWRPGASRDNAAMIHDKLVAWEQLNDHDKENDRVQVRAAMDIARLMHPRGFESRA